jgi:hypothetical protein
MEDNPRRFDLADPLTLAVVGTVAVTEGVKFLYNQAGELLKYWREKKKAAAGAAATSTPTPPEVKLPAAVFEGELAFLKVHDDVLDRVQQNISELRKALSEYADGVQEIEPGNEVILGQVDALRQLLEVVYQQRITFKGEKGRGPSGPVVEGEIDVDEVEGYAAASRAKNITGGRVYGKATAKNVKPGGILVGTDVGNVGPGPHGTDD